MKVLSVRAFVLLTLFFSFTFNVPNTALAQQKKDSRSKSATSACSHDGQT